MNKLNFLRKNQKGNIAIATAIMMPLLIGGAGFGVETAFWFYQDSQLQQASDKAVYTAAIEKRGGSNTKTILSAAITTATEHGYSPGTLIVNYPPTTGAYLGNVNAIEVQLTTELPRYFTSIFTKSPVIDKARAVAIMQNSADACVLALSKTASRAAQVSGSGNLKLTGCTIMSNSTAIDSVYAGGSAQMSADCIIAVGKVNLKIGSTTTTCAKPITNVPPASDPYANIPVPTSTTNRPNTTAGTLQPGNYINGMSLSGTKTLSPGVYIVSRGSFSINANANISGTGVTIYLAPGVSVSMNGNATVNLSAPKSGTYSGMLFFGDRANTTGVTFNGTAASKLTGALYFANQDIKYLGNFSGNGGCTRVVGKTIEWSGNTSISQDCTAYGMKTIPAMQVVKLVE